MFRVHNTCICISFYFTSLWFCHSRRYSYAAFLHSIKGFFSPRLFSNMFNSLILLDLWLWLLPTWWKTWCKWPLRDRLVKLTGLWHWHNIIVATRPNLRPMIFKPLKNAVCTCIGINNIDNCMSNNMTNFLNLTENKYELACSVIVHVIL